MSQHISSEKKATILSAVKVEGMGIVNAAKKHAVSEKTIRKWLNKQTKNEHTSAAEVEKLRRDLQSAKMLIGEVALSQQSKRKHPLILS